MVGLQLNGKGFGRKWLWPNQSSILEFSWRNWENHKKEGQATSVLAKIRTEYLLNTRLEHCLDTNLFDDCKIVQQITCLLMIETILHKLHQILCFPAYSTHLLQTFLIIVFHCCVIFVYKNDINKIYINLFFCWFHNKKWKCKNCMTVLIMQWNIIRAHAHTHTHICATHVDNWSGNQIVSFVSFHTGNFPAFFHIHFQSYILSNNMSRLVFTQSLVNNLHK
jgi:hypothetical protein